MDASAQPPAQSPYRPCAPGVAVRVKRYGDGKVVANDASTVTIRFASSEQRSFHPEYVRPVRSPRKAVIGPLHGAPAAPAAAQA